MRSETVSVECFALCRPDLIPQILLSNYRVLGAGASAGKNKACLHGTHVSWEETADKWLHKSMSGSWVDDQGSL